MLVTTRRKYIVLWWTHPPGRSGLLHRWYHLRWDCCSSTVLQECMPLFLLARLLALFSRGIHHSDNSNHQWKEYYPRCCYQILMLLVIHYFYLLPFQCCVLFMMKRLRICYSAIGVRYSDFIVSSQYNPSVCSVFWQNRKVNQHGLHQSENYAHLPSQTLFLL